MIKFVETVEGSEAKSNQTYKARLTGRQKVVSL